MKKKILFLCTHNSVRSQMAEGLLRHIGGGMVDSRSAGTVVTDVNPIAAKAMAEIGVDITRQRSKSLKEYADEKFDYVITVCDQADRSCPSFPGKYKRIHWSIVDPGTIPARTDEERLSYFRRTREELTRLIEKFVKEEIVS